jgi:hypothetical protein
MTLLGALPWSLFCVCLLALFSALLTLQTEPVHHGEANRFTHIIKGGLFHFSGQIADPSSSEGEEHPL